MQTYAVVDGEFRFVKIGRSGAIEDRLATLSTASPVPLVLMATFNGDIERDMHRVLAPHAARLEWSKYNGDVETTILTRMDATEEWYAARKRVRARQMRNGGTDRMGPLDLAMFDRSGRDRLAGVLCAGDTLGMAFGIPSDADLTAMIARARKGELIGVRKRLSACEALVRRELEAAEPTTVRFTQATFALEVLRNWKRRVGMELGVLHGAPRRA